VNGEVPHRLAQLTRQLCSAHPGQCKQCNPGQEEAERAQVTIMIIQKPAGRNQNGTPSHKRHLVKPIRHRTSAAG